jgi:hypothetical protein
MRDAGEFTERSEELVRDPSMWEVNGQESILFDVSQALDMNNEGELCPSDKVSIHISQLFDPTHMT